VDLEGGTLKNKPVNATQSFRIWESFSPGEMIDFNPSFAVTQNGNRWCVFRRELTPPVPGKGSVWGVKVDRDLMPLGEPIKFIELGEDPRVISAGNHLLIMSVTPEIGHNGWVSGTYMSLSRWDASGETPKYLGAIKLPKHPVGFNDSDGIKLGWEKNWVHFDAGEGKIGFIYSHHPWRVLILETNGEKRLSFAYQGEGPQWDWGPVRGGTPFMHFDNNHNISFFHSSKIIGSQRLYMTGAVLVEKSAPFRPVACSKNPLLLARYGVDIKRFGWKDNTFSVIFPSGGESTKTGWNLLCGIDDGEIGIIHVTRDEVLKGLVPLSSQSRRGTLHDFTGKHIRGDGPLLRLPSVVPGIAELSIIDFLRLVCGEGETFVDAGAHVGFYTFGLAPGFKRVHSFEPSKFQGDYFEQNLRLNPGREIHLHRVGLGDKEGTATLHVVSPDGGENTLSADVAWNHNVRETYEVPLRTLDSYEFQGVDLLKIDVEGLEVGVLQGARDTIARNRPFILIETWENKPERELVKRLMSEMNYTLEFIFPSAKELGFAIPREKRQDFNWFLGESV
jgi:FkbM family methyltransferase